MYHGKYGKPRLGLGAYNRKKKEGIEEVNLSL
jgi:hypothetical protein